MSKETAFQEVRLLDKVTATFPLNSKRLQLYQAQQILDLLTTASGDDLFVMVCGKLH